MAVSEIGKIFLDENDHLAEHLLLSIMIYIKDVSHICYFYLSQRKEGLSPATLSFLERFEGDSLNISVINSTINIKL
ncbi:MAG TPA: hypothetical protein DDY52_03120 [Candidatus Moranbacteria bacterium]|nr:MAG: hypothetical protein UR51_C0021G0005 [Candidatus Moranbacteria bacterium GW2011_GWF1_34_10]HBI17114.1 hypothetical protein [Candidatus Moranbacteria bacterium]